MINRHFTKLNGIIKKSSRSYCSSKSMTILQAKEPPWKVLFFGSDDFSLFSLKALFNECKGTGSLNKLEVVTCSHKNPVYKFSTKHQLPVHKWPLDLDKYDFDLGIVVSFGHLIPEYIINKLPLGMLNVHASLLPRWRGASPIVYALASGDTETGITIMRIRPKKFDVGEILQQAKVTIDRSMEMPQLHRELGELGAKHLVETIWHLKQRLANCKVQSEEGVTYAPKLKPDFAQIKWSCATAKDIHNLQRALRSIMPLKTSWQSIPVKLLDIAIWNEPRQCRMPGFVEYSRKNKTLIVECANKSWISVGNVGVQGKRIMSAADFYNGFISKLEKNKMACFT